MPWRVVRPGREADGAAEDRLLDILQHRRIVDPAAAALDVASARARVGTPWGCYESGQEGGPGVDSHGPVAELGDGALDRRPELPVGQGPGVDDEGGGERPPDPLVDESDRVMK